MIRVDTRNTVVLSGTRDYLIFVGSLLLPVVLLDYRMECQAKLTIVVVIMNNCHKNGKLYSKMEFAHSLKSFLAILYNSFVFMFIFYGTNPLPHRDGNSKKSI
jgi:hypothetical protein